MDEKKVLKKNLRMFPLGTVGRDMVYQLYTNFLLTYILLSRRLTTAQIAAITAIMMAARIFDALNDPLMGNIIERTRGKWGKFKPWLLAGILTTSAVVFFAFNNSLQGWSFIVFFGVNYFLYSITYTMHDISYWGMVPALGSDGNVRDRFASRATLFAGIGGTLASVLIPMLTVGDFQIAESASKSYGIVALVICILAPAFLLFTLFGVRENRDYGSAPAPKVSLKKIWKTVTGNDQLRWIALIFLIQQIGNGIVLGGIGTFYIYFSYGYEGGLYSLFTIIGMVPTAFLMVFYPVLSKKLHRKPLMGIMMLFGAAGYAAMLFGGLVLNSFWVLTAGYALSSFGQYGFYLVMMISILNTVEYNEYRTGSRDEAIIASLRPFLTKMASALIVGLTSLCYVLFRITDRTNAISEIENNAGMGLISDAEKAARIAGEIQGVSGGQTLGMLLFITVVPFALMFASWLMYRKFYKLDEDEYDRICAELKR